MVGLARVWSFHFSKSLPFEGIVTSIGKALVCPTPKVTKNQPNDPQIPSHLELEQASDFYQSNTLCISLNPNTEQSYTK